MITNSRHQPYNHRNSLPFESSVFFLIFTLFVFRVLFFLSPSWPLLTLVLLRKENSQIKNDCLLVPAAMSPRLSHNHFTLSAFTAVIFSSAWWQPYCQHKDKKLDLSRELNVPSISTILLIFHQSCGSSSEPRSYYSLRATASNWQAWELQWKFAMQESCDGNWVWLGNLMRNSSNWFAKNQSKQTGNWEWYFTCCQHGNLERT